MPNDFALFYEQSPGHDFLYEVYADAVRSRLIVPPTNPWDRSEEGIRRATAALEAALAEARDLDVPLMFITLDPFISKDYRSILIEAAARHRRPIAGIIHRYSRWPKADETIADFANSIRCCVLGDETAARALEYGLDAHVLPVHPSIVTVPPRPGAERPEGRVTLSLLGELRGGKGLDLVLDTLGLLDPLLQRQLHLRFGGRADDTTRSRVEAAVAGTLMSAEIVLRRGEDFDALTAIEFADLCYGTDIGLLLYQDHQRDTMSGVLPNLVAVGAAVIGTRNSVVGDIIVRRGLGIAIEDETPAALRDAIERLLDPALRAAINISRHYAHYRRLSAPDNVNRVLRRVLDLPEIA